MVVKKSEKFEDVIYGSPPPTLYTREILATSC